nr:unnamed protein product [Digitaria exilis]
MDGDRRGSIQQRTYLVYVAALTSPIKQRLNVTPVSSEVPTRNPNERTNAGPDLASTSSQSALPSCCLIPPWALSDAVHFFLVPLATGDADHRLIEAAATTRPTVYTNHRDARTPAACGLPDDSF